MKNKLSKEQLDLLNKFKNTKDNKSAANLNEKTESKINSVSHRPNLRRSGSRGK
jgi:hypothetical protein